MAPMRLDRNRPIRPQRLSTDDTIAVVAPAGSFDPEAVYRGAAVLEELGFKTRIPQEALLKTAYLAGSDRQRADLLNRLFADPSVDGIICARGGYGSLRILNRLDYRCIRQHPKPFIGFSDVTAVLTALYQRCGLVGFHGPMLGTLDNADQATHAALRHALSSGDGITLKSTASATGCPGRVTAPVMTGNLTTFCHLLGTPFAPDFSGHIVLFEDRGEALYRIDRMLTQMKLAGCFDGVVGVALGSFSNCGRYGEVVSLFEDVFKNRPVPMSAGFQVGHGPCNLTVPMGLTATLDTESRQLSFPISATDE